MENKSCNGPERTFRPALFLLCYLGSIVLLSVLAVLAIIFRPFA